VEKDFVKVANQLPFTEKSLGQIDVFVIDQIL
jgi:hypothetical protein